MNKNNYLIFGIILLGSMVLMTSYTAPAYNQVNMTLCNSYTPPSYSSINFTLGDSDACAATTCAFQVNGAWSVPSNCTCISPPNTQTFDLSTWSCAYI